MPAYRPGDIHTLFRDAFNIADVEGVTALYEPDAVLMVGGKAVPGRENIRKALESILTRRGWMTLATRAIVESPQGLAVLHGAWTIVSGTGTDAPIETRGLSTEVVRKQPDGTWLLVIDNPSTPV